MREMPELKVEEIGTDELIPYANNAKIHTREQVDQICKSIEEFGFNDPIAVWEGPGGLEIVEGHGRVMAAKKLNIDKVPIIRLDHLSNEQRREYTHVHNQLTMNTGWDFETLEAELEELELDWEQFGFDKISKSVEREREIDEAVTCDQKPAVRFTEFVDEESQYVVLKFKTSQEWLQAQSVLGLQQVSSYTTRKFGDTESGTKFTGLGRVVDGVDAFRRIHRNFSDLER